MLTAKYCLGKRKDHCVVSSFCYYLFIITLLKDPVHEDPGFIHKEVPLFQKRISVPEWIFKLKTCINTSHFTGYAEGMVAIMKYKCGQNGTDSTNVVLYFDGLSCALRK